MLDIDPEEPLGSLQDLLPDRELRQLLMDLQVDKYDFDWFESGECENQLDFCPRYDYDCEVYLVHRMGHWSDNEWIDEEDAVFVTGRRCEDEDGDLCVITSNDEVTPLQNINTGHLTITVDMMTKLIERMHRGELGPRLITVVEVRARAAALKMLRNDRRRRGGTIMDAYLNLQMQLLAVPSAVAAPPKPTRAPIPVPQPTVPRPAALPLAAPLVPPAAELPPAGEPPIAAEAPAALLRAALPAENAPIQDAEALDLPRITVENATEYPPPPLIRYPPGSRGPGSAPAIWFEQMTGMKHRGYSRGKDVEARLGVAEWDLATKRYRRLLPTNRAAESVREAKRVRSVNAKNPTTTRVNKRKRLGALLPSHVHGYVEGLYPISC